MCYAGHVNMLFCTCFGYKIKKYCKISPTVKTISWIYHFNLDQRLIKLSKHPGDSTSKTSWKIEWKQAHDRDRLETMTWDNFKLVCIIYRKTWYKPGEKGVGPHRIRFRRCPHNQENGTQVTKWCIICANLAFDFTFLLPTTNHNHENGRYPKINFQIYINNFVH